MELESDAANAVNLVNSIANTHQLHDLINACRYLCQELGNPPISHVLRESNKCADQLAQDARCHRYPYLAYLSIPFCIKVQMLEDQRGFCYP